MIFSIFTTILCGSLTHADHLKSDSLHSPVGVGLFKHEDTGDPHVNLYLHTCRRYRTFDILVWKS